jgi:cysteine desulfurase
VTTLVYLDSAASTVPAPEALEAMGRAAATHFANPASAHGPGAAAARALEQARADVAALLGAAPAEIVFTSGGTEADALGVAGAASCARGRHLVAGATEHPAVLRTIEALAGRGFRFTLVAPGPDGRLRPGDVAAAVEPDTAVVAVMLVNNELGTLQPVADIARAVAAARAGTPGRPPHIHCDAVQAAGLVPIVAAQLGVDSLAISAHKLHGPKGAGALWLRPGARIAPLWDGGRQERGLRSGTENLPAQVGFGVAAQLARAALRGGSGPGASDGAPARVGRLRDQLEGEIAHLVPEARPTVPAGAPRAPHIASVLLPDLPAEPLLHALESRGVIAAAGSACASKTRGPSHVLRAMGVPDSAAVLRFSLSRMSADADPGLAARALRQAVDEVAAVAQPARRARPGTRGA